MWPSYVVSTFDLWLSRFFSASLQLVIQHFFVVLFCIVFYCSCNFSLVLGLCLCSIHLLHHHFRTLTLSSLCLSLLFKFSVESFSSVNGYFLCFLFNFSLCSCIVLLILLFIWSCSSLNSFKMIIPSSLSNSSQISFCWC